MAEKMGIYKCMVCGNVVEDIVPGKGELICCGEPMKLMDEKNKDGAGEKHVPVIEASGDGVLVKIGSVPHPMEADHWIQFIEVISTDGFVTRKDLNPGDKPEVFFQIPVAKISVVREFCNKHGLWAK
ncbi:MAG: desulfoferrodoxin [Candidatus Goldbacteria bacterium]|nr:desulfoferrodoxin [Candidatus Goldiibacteriota bacterium]